MPTQGQILYNPVTEDTFEFLKTAKDTDGVRVVMKDTIRGKSKMVRDDMHRVKDDTYELVLGTMTVWQGGKLSRLPTGEWITLGRHDKI